MRPVARVGGEEALDAVFDRWKSEQGRAWFREELFAWSERTWRDFLERTGRLFDGLAGNRALEPDDILPPTRSRKIVLSIANTLTSAGVPDAEVFERVHAFLFSDAIAGVHRLRIQALMWAGMAHQTAHGSRLKPPGRGAVTDVNVISTVLPYLRRGTHRPRNARTPRNGAGPNQTGP